MACLGLVLCGSTVETGPYWNGTAQADATDEDELHCLAEAIYFEARSETVFGQVAVAEVVLNRRDDPRFPDTVCGVVRQGYDPVRHNLHRCQFSYYCDGKPEYFGNKTEYARIEALAWSVLNRPSRNFTGGATHYHATYVNPSWAPKLRFVRTIGQHHFYSMDPLE